MNNTQQSRTVSWAPPPPPNPKRKGCCLVILLIPILFVGICGVILLTLGDRTNILILGLDSRDSQSDLGRSDTIILTTIVPRQGYIGMLSIPRDLWVFIPDYGENRINTAHFFGEAGKPGSGPELAKQTIRQNFNIDLNYYLRIRFDGFLDIVELVDGVEVELPIAMSGYPAGKHHLNGEQALGFVRDRSGSDDFYRMQRSQIFLIALLKRLTEPSSWQRLPETLPIIFKVVDTDLPITKWFILGISMMRVSPDSIDARVINRDMTQPFTTAEGAQVLNPNWRLINPILLDMFEQQ